MGIASGNCYVMKNGRIVKEGTGEALENDT